MSIAGNIEKIIADNELGFKALPLAEFIIQNNIEINFSSNNNSNTSNSDVERLHNTINEHIRLLKHDPEKDNDSVEEKMNKIIMFYNITMHSTTGRRPVDFQNGMIKPGEYSRIRIRILKYT